jgi:hypothetical protein
MPTVFVARDPAVAVDAPDSLAGVLTMREMEPRRDTPHRWNDRDAPVLAWFEPYMAFRAAVVDRSGAIDVGPMARKARTFRRQTHLPRTLDPGRADVTSLATKVAMGGMSMVDTERSLRFGIDDRRQPAARGARIGLRSRGKPTYRRRGHEPERQARA